VLPVNLEAAAAAAAKKLRNWIDDPTRQPGKLAALRRHEATKGVRWAGCSSFFFGGTTIVKMERLG
jgi:hypothetical protein